MSDTFYKPLTPSLRKDINSSIEKNISELQTCKTNGLVNMQITAQSALKNLINNLPDGYLIPMERRK
jgi:hypothetical protein